MKLPIKRRTRDLKLIPHLHSVHNGSRIRHLHERGDADGTAQENRIEAENSVG